MSPSKNNANYNGSAIARGPMASDHYTTIHNLIVRGKAGIHTKYVGVWGFISSHQEGWKLNAKGVASDLGVGVDFVNSALKAFEKASLLIRSRDRDSAGRLGDSIWFITDLPVALQQLGITDPEVAHVKVQEAYAEWLAANAPQEPLPGTEPETENPVQGVTCENEASSSGEEPDKTENSRSGPKPGFPEQAEPSWVNPARKKTKPQNPMGEEHQPTSASAETSDSEHTAGDDLGWLDDESPNTKSHHDTGHLSEPPAAGDTEGADELEVRAVAFIKTAEFPDGSGFASHTVSLKEHVADLLRSGWEEPEIQVEITSTEGLSSAVRSWPAFARRRLESMRPKVKGKRNTAVVDDTPAWCGRCEAPDYRFVLDPVTRDPKRCRCNPNYVHDFTPRDLPPAGDTEGAESSLVRARRLVNVLDIDGLAAEELALAELSYISAAVDQYGEDSTYQHLSALVESASDPIKAIRGRLPGLVADMRGQTAA